MRGVKGTGPNGVKDEGVMMTLSSDAVELKMVTLHATITWPGVPKLADTTVTDAKVPGIKMYLISNGTWLHMTCGQLHCDLPVSAIKVAFRKEPLEL